MIGLVDEHLAGNEGNMEDGPPVLEMLVRDSRDQGVALQHIMPNGREICPTMAGYTAPLH